MTDRNANVRHLRSLAAAPQLSDLETRQWRDALACLDSKNFRTLMEPLLDDGRRRLLELPDWSRTVLFERYLREAPP